MNRAEIAVLIACFVVALLGGLIGWLDYRRAEATEASEPLTLEEEERQRRESLELSLPETHFGTVPVLRER